MAHTLSTEDIVRLAAPRPCYTAGDLAAIPADELACMVADLPYVRRELDRQADQLRCWSLPGDTRDVLYWRLHSVMDDLDALGVVLQEERQRRAGQCG